MSKVAQDENVSLLTQFSDPLDVLWELGCYGRGKSSNLSEKIQTQVSQLSQVPAFIVEAGNCKLLWLGYDCIYCTGSQLTVAVLRKQTDTTHFFSGLCRSSLILLTVLITKGKGEH